MLVPAIASTGMCISSSAVSTPTCASPREPPPESTSPMRGRPAGSASCAFAGMAGSAAAKQQSIAETRNILGFTGSGDGSTHVDGGCRQNPIMIRMFPTPATRRKFGFAALLIAPCLHAETLDPVIVTATRSPVALKTYAGSATRIAGGDVALVGATHSSELVNRAAGAMIQRGSGEESLTALRSPVLTGAGACGSVLVLEDGIPIRPVGTCNVNELFEVNLEQA